jgi:hydroxylamine dehydrogenase
MQRQRVLITAAVATVIFIGLAVVLAVIFRPMATAEEGHAERENVLVQSTNDCVTCHANTTPGIVAQYGVSTMAAADVSCEACHQVAADYPNAIEHEGTYVVNSPSPAMCEDCHTAEVAQFAQSRHGLPAYVAVAGSQNLSDVHLEQYLSVTEGQPSPDKSRNAIAALEGDDLTRFTCYGCHNIGRPHEDGSAGECQQCHLRHEFNLEQARRPETCNACHIGPDHPQYEIYMQSPHGIAYATMGDNWNWDAEPGTLTVEDFPAPTCAICHMSGMGTTSTTHDVGDRLTWFLFMPVSERRPAYTDNAVRMQSICLECHNQNFVDDFYQAADAATERVNEWTQEGQDTAAALRDAGALTSAPFDEPIDFTIFNLWHHWGRTAKFGVWMQGPDYSQWHGAYEVLHDLAELREYAVENLDGYVHPRHADNEEAAADTATDEAVDAEADDSADTDS